MTTRNPQPLQPGKPVIIIGAGPIGLTTALGLAYYGIPFKIYEEDGDLSKDTKAGTILTRTLEAFRRYGVADGVLAQALRVDEIGEVERATQIQTRSIQTSLLKDDTRYPFVINLPQNALEAILGPAVESRGEDVLHMNYRMTGFTSTDNGVHVTFETPEGAKTVDGRYLLACDGGRSSVRKLLNIPVEGKSLDIRYMLVDLEVDLDLSNPRDYPYLAYFSDPDEWMILIRQPHCWRFLYPLAKDAVEPAEAELAAKVLQFIGKVDHLKIINTVIYNVHHRIARKWRDGPSFLMGDAAHLITPMWALGLNTGILDTISLPWRLAWVMRGWASGRLLDGYEREQRPVAAEGSAEMAETARAHMQAQKSGARAMSGEDWGNAYTRTLLGVRLDIDGTGNWSMVKTEASPPPVRVGERIPDFELHGPDGRPLRLHDLTGDSFLALYFVDTRRRPDIPLNISPALKHYAVSRWDAPHDSGLRDRSLLDVGECFRKRLGVADNILVLIRPDDHIAAILPISTDAAKNLYEKIVGAPLPLMETL